VHAAFGRHRERRSRVAIQPYLAAVAGLTAGLLRFTRNDALKRRTETAFPSEHSML